MKSRLLLKEIRLTVDRLHSGVIQLPAGLRLDPGRYILANGVDDPRELFPTPLFAMCEQKNGLVQVAPPLPESWYAGMSLAARGPLGKGFQLPASAHHVVLGSTSSPVPHRLLALIAPALRQGAAVAVAGSALPDGLPAEVEWISPDSLAEAAAQWADFTALEVSFAEIKNLRSLLGLKPGSHPSGQIQILATGAMPCGGNAACGLCSIPGRKSQRLACTDGPVFPWEELEEG